MRTRTFFLLPLLFLGVLLAGCDSLFGSKDDAVTDEIFDAGRAEPSLINEVEYVPLFPFFTQGFSGTFTSPRDVYVGYDELIYVADDDGVHILDLSGRAAALIAIPGGATSVIQDRRMHLYVTARRDTVLAGESWNLPVVYRFDGISSGSPRMADIIWHPFDDDSRRFNRPDPVPSDEDVAFTSVGVLPDNNVYISRTGPVNDSGSILLPHNIILEFRPDGSPRQALISLSPTNPSLRSAVYPSTVTTFVHPPQRAFFGTDRHFLVGQTPGPAGGGPLRFSALSIRVVDTPNGTEFQPDAQKLQITFNPEAGNSFLYDEFKFDRVGDITVAMDGTNFIFVVDAGADSLHVFTGQGVEGVSPPPGSSSTLPVNVSFGGSGDGSGQFNNPLGVAYFKRIVYVADTGNNRISRFRLNTDFE
ncbi:MAG: hypothetical protein COV99_06185 [Bacteroidetes bacterium CG12_big_fil_rev_8_21_14_0_65_60_17]|nr:MAG: hypothetical protein COV99_06185 [Bacteroidetes bacterium CG12_big_fil_rev_8_21_14_0_65_60_17]